MYENVTDDQIVDLAKKILAERAKGRAMITSWSGLTDYLTVHLCGERVEVFHVLFLDRKNRLIADERMGTGTIDHVPVYPREIMARALTLDACAIILCHNHPSGDVTPSESDKTMTRQVQSACEVMGITMHDHVIVGGGTFCSLRALGVL